MVVGVVRLCKGLGESKGFRLHACLARTSQRRKRCRQRCVPCPPPRPPADPLGLGTEPKSLERFVEAEVINGRWAMLGVAGMIGVEALGYGDWYAAPQWAVTGGKATYFGSELPFQFDLGTLAAIVSRGWGCGPVGCRAGLGWAGGLTERQNSSQRR